MQSSSDKTLSYTIYTYTLHTQIVDILYPVLRKHAQLLLTEHCENSHDSLPYMRQLQTLSARTHSHV